VESKRGAILAPFARLDTDASALTFDGRELEADDFTDTQARGIGGHQEDTVPGWLGTREQALEFRDAQDLGQLQPPWARREVQIQGLPPQGLGIDKAEPTGSLVRGTPGQLALDARGRSPGWPPGGP
jgi:hypothetical protein